MNELQPHVRPCDNLEKPANGGVSQSAGFGGYFTISLLLLAFYYLSYRYPLQMNSSTTSPTYRDTPFIYQAGKYGIFFLILIFFGCWGLFRGRFQKITWFNAIEFIFYLYLMTISAFGTILTKDFDLLQTGIFYSALLLLFIFPFSLRIQPVYRTITIFLVVSIIIEAVQILLFLSLDRLPALAYRNTIFVRFGSIWDDPNGFALMISFFIPWVVFIKRRLPVKLLLAFGLLLMLILTQSFTGLAAVFVCLWVGIWLLAVVKTVPVRIPIYVTIAYGILFCLFFAIVVPSQIYQFFMIHKAQSIKDHLSIFWYLKNIQVDRILGLNPAGMYGESGYINIMLNFGILFLVIYLLIGIIAVRRLLWMIRYFYGKSGVGLFYGAFFFLIAFYLGMLNLPLDTIFPLNLIQVICIMLPLFNYQDTIPKYKEYKL